PQLAAGAKESLVAGAAAPVPRPWWLSWKVTVPVVATLLAGVTAVALFMRPLTDWARNEFTEDARFLPDRCQLIVSINMDAIQATEDGRKIARELSARDPEGSTSDEEGYKQSGALTPTEIRSHRIRATLK